MKKDALTIAVLITLAYSDIFDYPLTNEEIAKRLVLGQFGRPSRDKLLSILKQHPQIDSAQGYFFIKGRTNLVRRRLQRAKWSSKKWQEVEDIKQILEKIPLITNVYVTGSLSMNNISSPEDDIDLLVVTKPGTLWLTRLWVMWLIMPLGKYRRFASKGENAWCFNLWLEETSLTMPSQFRSLYAAYEVLQAKSIFENKKQLIMANQWIKEYVFYSTEIGQKKNYPAVSLPKTSTPILFQLINAICYLIQRIYMWPHQTRERVGWGYAFFHPRDTRRWVERELHKRIL